MRLLSIFIALALLLAVPFLLWGDAFQKKFAEEKAVDAWMQDYGSWAWMVGVLLLAADLILPVPSTAVMSALGLVYGVFLGGLIGAVGSILSGCLGYGICRSLGREAAIRVAGEKDLRRGERLFASVGGWVVALSRWLPLLPEVVACMAGLSRMPPAHFFLALVCGTLPLAFSFAALGERGVDNPVLALSLSAALPVVLWPLARWFLKRRAASVERGSRPGTNSGFRS